MTSSRMSPVRQMRPVPRRSEADAQDSHEDNRMEREDEGDIELLEELWRGRRRCFALCALGTNRPEPVSQHGALLQR